MDEAAKDPRKVTKASKAKAAGVAKAAVEKATTAKAKAGEVKAFKGTASTAANKATKPLNADHPRQTPALTQ